MFNIYNQKNGNGDQIEAEMNGAKNKGRKPNFVQYTDPTQELPAQEFKWGFWFVRNRVILYRVTVGVLIGLSVIFWLYVLVKGGSLALYSLESGGKLDRDLAYFYDYSVIHPSYSAQPLLIANTQVLPGGVGKYDLVSEVSNPNERFLVNFDYYFIVGGVTTDVKKTFLLPNETRLIADLGYAASYPSGAELVVTNLKWKRISNHTIKDIESWQAERLNFSVSDFSFTRSGEMVDGVAANVVKFNLNNVSPYSYAQAVFQVNLYQGNALVGVLPLELFNFLSGQIRAIDLRSFVTGLNVTDAKVVPLINIYNNSIYLAPEK